MADRSTASKKAPQVNGLVTLTTDFGTLDGYVGAMKGCILRLAPNATLVDLSHAIPPQRIAAGAWCLRRSVPQFPPGTVHVGVVDPTVGSARRALAIQAGGQWLVGPDNGLLCLAARALGVERILHINEDLPWLEKSASFDGLRLFSPTAARLAAGLDPAELGEELAELVDLVTPQSSRKGLSVEGEVVAFDRFGNGITNIPQGELNNASVDKVYLQPSHEGRMVHHYNELGPDQMGALWNSDGFLELAYKGQSMAARLQLEGGERVRVYLRG